MATCKHYQEQIELDLDGELSASLRTELASHLAVCPQCSEYRAEALIFRRTLATGLQLLPPRDIVEPVLAKIKKRRAWRRVGFTAILLLPFLCINMLSAQKVAQIILSLNFGALPTLLSSIWRSVTVLFRSWIRIAEILPEEYWLGLSALALFNLAMVLKLYAPKRVRGGKAH
jgi:predicted anti-sigma-YlaC factor YlaD